MPLMKKVNNADPGDADHVGGNDWDLVADYFNNVDVSGTSGAIKINTDTDWRSSRLRLMNPAGTFSYVFTGAAIAANRILNLPLLTGTDTLATLGFGQTFSNKTLDGTCDVSAAIGAGGGVLLNGTNSFGDFDNSFKDNRLRLWNPADTFRGTFVMGAIAANRNMTIPVLTGDDTFVFLNQSQTVKNKKFSDGYGSPNDNEFEFVSIENPYHIVANGNTPTRTGMFFGTGSTNAIGVLSSGITSIGSVTQIDRSSSEGSSFEYQTGAVANANAGLRWTTAAYRREWGIYMILRVKFSSTSDVRCFIGFSSDVNEIAGETTLNNFEGFGVGKRTGDTNWQVMRNDGDATEDRTDSGVAFATTAVTIELALNSTNFRSRIGSTENTAITTEIPAAATNLAPHVEIETGAGAATKSIFIYPIYCRVGTV